MNEIKAGEYVALTLGTTVFVNYEGSEKSERMTVNEDWDGIVLQVQGVGCSHSTMNGGGHDYTLTDPWSATVTRVRTTFSRPERETFVRKTKRDAGVV